MCVINKILIIIGVAIIFASNLSLIGLNLVNYSKLNEIEKPAQIFELTQKFTNLSESRIKMFKSDIINMFKDHTMMIKNQILKILIELNTTENKIISQFKSQKTKKINVDTSDKLNDVLTIVEKIYDYSAMNENSRLNDNYNYFNVIKNQIIAYFDSKIESLITKKCNP